MRLKKSLTITSDLGWIERKFLHSKYDGMGAEEATGNSEDFCHMPWLAKKGVPPIMTLFDKISKSMERNCRVYYKKNGSMIPISYKNLP